MKMTFAARAELDEMKARNASFTPEDIVAQAHSPNSALHAMFEWDDSEAGRRWRLQQASTVRRVYVKVTSSASAPRQPQRVVVSTIAAVKNSDPPRVVTPTESDMVARFASDLTMLISKYRTTAALRDQVEMLLEMIPDTRKVPAMRACLSCGTQFQSEGAGNRICPKCRAGKANGSFDHPYAP